MRTGMVFGKFMPLHKGHLALIGFALKHCDHLNIVLCYTLKDPISGDTRLKWLKNVFDGNEKITVIPFLYDDAVLPNTSVSSKAVSKLWADAFKELLPKADIIFTSEPYGEFVAEYMNVQHLEFDRERKTIPVSSTVLRGQPFKYWNFLPPQVRTYFIKKICIVGTESTGKSMLTEKLARYFNTAYVPEMAREIVELTESCTYEDLLKIAGLHAKTINQKISEADRLLFVDTDVNITASYSAFLFNKKLNIEYWIEEVNKFDLYLFLEPDCDYVQDGTRLSAEERNRLSEHHKKFFQTRGIDFISISGDWEDRFTTARKIIADRFGPLS